MTSNCFSLPIEPGRRNTSFHAGVRYRSGSGKIFVLADSTCTKLIMGLRKPTPGNVSRIFFERYSYEYLDQTLRHPTANEAIDFLRECPDDHITNVVSDGSYFFNDGTTAMWQPPGNWYTTKSDYDFSFDYWRREFRQLFIEVDKS